MFGNWFGAAVRYLLIKHGLASGLVMVRCGGLVHGLSPDLYSFIVNSYYDGNINDVHCLDSRINLRYRDIPLAVIPPSFIEFSYSNKSIRLTSPISFIYDILFENFLGGAYDDVDVSGRVVVDVGAGIGDTAVLFALRGAERVIALEPYPSLYEKALMNVRINGLEDKVVLLNAAVSDTDGFTYAPTQEIRDYVLFRPMTHKSSESVRIRTITLRTLVKEYGVSNGILKMDCEGCEYEVINSAEPETLRAFGQIIIEYHKGSEPIVTRLKNLGYSIAMKPIKSSNVSMNIQGYIIANFNK
ncbi:FkbM family methyltransferase [Vulcanisaeta sp. JCM 14467]